MKKLIKALVEIGVVVALIFVFSEPLTQFARQVEDKYFPCKRPIAYNIGVFDEWFGISKETFFSALTSAEAIWEGPVSKNLFAYSPDGYLKINLMYDERQEATVTLQSLGFTLQNDQANYDAMKAKYDSLNSSYKQKAALYESKVATFEAEKSAYEKAVSAANRRGKITKEQYDSLNAEKDRLNAEVIEINKLKDELNYQVEQINTLAGALNSVAKSLNLTADKFNSISGQFVGEFEEGTYTSSAEREEINIYQFENKLKLVRVLAHEFGHALGLLHVEDPKAIMYRLNNGINEKLTNADLVELKELCGLN